MPLMVGDIIIENMSMLSVQVVVFTGMVPDQNSLLTKPHFILLAEFKDMQWLYSLPVSFLQQGFTLSAFIL